MVGGALHTDTARELQLPVVSTKPTFGMGLTSAETISPSAYIASSILVRPLLPGLVPQPSQLALFNHPDLLAAWRAWHTSVGFLASYSLDDMDRRQLRQSDLATLTHSAIIDALPPGIPRRRAHRNNLGLPEAKRWLSCPPRPALGVHIRDADFILWLKFYCGVPIFEHGVKCPRYGCNSPVDPFGDHGLSCKHASWSRNAPILRRHDVLVRLLAGLLHRANRAPSVEPFTLGPRQRPDIRALGTRRARDYLDLVISHPLSCNERITRNITQPGSTVGSAVCKKHTKYADFIAADGDAELIPISISTLGGWHEDGHYYFKHIARTIGNKSAAPPSFFSNLVFGRVATQLITLNAACLRAGKPTVS